MSAYPPRVGVGRFNMSKVSRIVQKGDMLKLTFEDCVDSPVSRIFFRASTEGEAIAWARALRLRYQAVLLHDLTVRCDSLTRTEFPACGPPPTATAAAAAAH